MLRLWESQQLTDRSGGQNYLVSISLSKPLLIQMQNDFNVVMGARSLFALQSIYRIIQKKKS